MKTQPFYSLNLPVFAKKSFKEILNRSFFILLFGISTTLYSQSTPTFIQEWQPLEEAEFHYDVSYAVVKCSPSSKAIVLLHTFNESGAETNVGFTFNLTDSSGKTAKVTVPIFSSKLGDMKMSSCESDENSNLKFEVPAGIDAATMKIEITYNTGS